MALLLNPGIYSGQSFAPAQRCRTHPYSSPPAALRVGYFVFWGVVVVETFERYGSKLLTLIGWGA